MVQVPVVRHINRSSISEAPDWIVKILRPLNLTNEALHFALANRITFGENIAAEIRNLRFTTSSTYIASDDFETITFNNVLGTKVLDVRIAKYDIVADNYAPITKAVSLAWRELDSVIRIEHIAGLADSTEYTFTIIVYI